METPTPTSPEPPPWHALDEETVASRLQTGHHGLSQAEAAARLRRDGPNQLEEIPPPSALVLLGRQLASPLIYLLLVAAVVTTALGAYVDAGVIAVAVALNAVIGFTQERRAEISVRGLMALVSPRAHVVREGRAWEVDSRELVGGDLVLLESGVRVPADLRLVSAVSLAVDESLLTGESIPAHKDVRPVAADRVLAERTNMAYAGTVITSGRGRGYVVATADRTALGAIAAEMREEEQTRSPLQTRMDRFARVVAVVVGVSAAVASGLGVALGYRWSDMFMLAVAVAVAAIPEGLPAVLTVVLAVGVRRMARRNAIIRRLPAVETLGSTTVIGSDKTGTLTENRMTVEEIWAGGRTFSIPRPAGPLEPDPTAAQALREHPALELSLLTGVLTNEAQVYVAGDAVEQRGDPTEAALLVAAARMGIDPSEAQAAHEVFAEIPFEPDRQYSASLRIRDGGIIAFVKGAPERVLGMCARMATHQGEVPLDRGPVVAAVRAMASRGLRVLALAHARLPHPLHAPPDPERIGDPSGLSLLGLVGMMDPPRPGVREAIAGCRRSGIRVMMITGDHAATAEAIGQALGIAPPGAPVLTGAEVARMDEDRLKEEVRRVSIFARVAPDQKLRVVRALQSQGEAVAVTGDGVNDAPALRAADIGIAMGKSGTDVAREAADMVLADDNFVSIQAAVEEGRITFDNLRKSTFFLISTGAATLLTILASMAMRWPVPFVPAQLLWLNLVTNGLQDVALAFEPGERGVVERPPRPRTEGIISRILWERTVVVGLVMAAGTLALFRWELAAGASLARAQTVALTGLVLFQVFHTGNARSESLSIFAKSPFSNRFLFLATLASVIVHVAALNLGPTQFVLRVEPLLDVEVWLRMIGVAASILVAVELHKRIRRRDRPSRASAAR